jgi:lipopolysaccharide biosynthesis protein
MEMKQKLRRGIHPVRSLALRAAGLLKRSVMPIRGRWKGSVAPNDKSVVYVHFDESGVVHDFTLYQLHCFKSLGYGITFVTNSPSFPADQMPGLLPLCVHIIWRHNSGYDFGAYRDAILSLDTDSVTQLILTNDSIYGPFYPLQDLIDRCDPEKADVWGASDSREIGYHLQSCFLLFHGNAIRSDAFRNFWRWYPDADDKVWVILNGELGISRALANDGLRLRAVYSCEDAKERRKAQRQCREFSDVTEDADDRSDQLNPLSYYWETMIARERFPFMKRSIFLRQPEKALSVVSSRTRYDPRLICRHLQSMPGAIKCVQSL